MSILDIKIPAIGESITEVTLSEWLVKDGAFVNQGDLICELESDKATVEMPAENSGVIKIIVEEGEVYEIGAKIAEFDTSRSNSESTENIIEIKDRQNSIDSTPDVIASPAAKKMIDEKGIDIQSIQASGKDGRITKGDVLSQSAVKIETIHEIKKAVVEAVDEKRVKTIKKMSGIRKTIAKILVEAKNTTAMLTTFNEVDMSEVMQLRKMYKERFKEKHGIGLGFMSFFTKACCAALKEYPGVNAQIKGNEIIYHEYVDMGVAVSTEKGLVVPIIRNAESLGFSVIENTILALAKKARDGKISIDEMKNGTFTITNGGIFGSMLSTPIINIPQSAILGMHNIVNRPVAIGNQVEIRPIMYLALSYDHRIVDGRESVSFLKMVKEMIEEPARLMLEI